MFLFVLNQGNLLGGNETGMRSTWIERGKSLRGNFRLEVELLYEYSTEILGKVLGEMQQGGEAEDVNLQGNIEYHVLRTGLLTRVLPMNLLVRFRGPK